MPLAIWSGNKYGRTNQNITGCKNENDHAVKAGAIGNLSW
jgi:hypothetical protein